jgi:hypothetical protein
MAVSSAAVKDYANKGVSAGWGAAKWAVNAPVRVAEGERISIIPQWMRKLFKWLGLIAGWNYYQSGLGASQVTHAGTAAESTGALVLGKLGLTTIRDAIYGNYNYGFESDIEQTQTDPDLGVKISDLRQVGLPQYGEPVEIIGTIKAKSPEDDLKLIVNCRLDDGDLIPAIVSSTTSSGNEATLYKGQLEVIQASCVFPKGIQPEKVTMVRPGTKQTEPIKTSKQARMYADFEYKTKASHNTYFMPSAELSEILKLNKEPFTLYKVNDPQLTYDRKITSITTAGPIKVGIGTLVSQPFVEDRPYSFGITLANNLDWSGNLKKLEQIYVYLPPFLYLDGEKEFGEKQFTSTCAFDPTGQIDQDGFKIYKIKESLLAQTNKECNKETLKSLSLTEQQCIDLFGKNRDITFRCNFKAPETQGQGLQYDFIRAEAKYIYQTERVIAVDAIKRQEIATNIA